ncbi:MAG: hypothetical protein V3W34_20610 [Phycisphaerae bacterium]
MWAALGKFIGGKVLTAVLVVAAGASLIWAWNNPEALQAVWATSKGALVWLGFVLVFPWAMFFVPVKVVKLESNGAAAAMLLGYLAVDILAAYWLADWSIQGTLTWAVVLLGFLAAGAYNFIVCDYVAARTEETV